MKLKRILAVALSVATVAGAGVMAAVSADAATKYSKYDRYVVANQTGDFFRGKRCGGSVGYDPVWTEDYIFLNKAAQTTIRYKAADNQVRWAVECGSYDNWRKGVYCNIIKDREEKNSNVWKPGSYTLHTYTCAIGSNGKNYYKYQSNGSDGTECYNNVGLVWAWTTPSLRGGNFTAEYYTHNFKLCGIVRNK